MIKRDKLGRFIEGSQNFPSKKTRKKMREAKEGKQPINSLNWKGKNHPKFKGRIKRSGYWYIYKPEHPNSGKQNYVAEHRLIMEKYLDRYLKLEEVVHHRNGIITDNRIENLELFASHGQHTKLAHPEILQKLNSILS